MPYYFSWFIALIFRDQSVYFCVSNCSWNCKTSGVCERRFTLPESYRTSMASWVASNYRYLFIRANSCILFIFLFKPSVWDRAETELKCNTGLRETVQNCHFSHTDSWYLVPKTRHQLRLSTVLLNLSLVPGPAITNCWCSGCQQAAPE